MKNHGPPGSFGFSWYHAATRGSVTLNVPEMQLDQTDPAKSGTLRLYVDDRSVIRAKADKISGLTPMAKGDGAIAVDEAKQASFRAITNETAKVYAAQLSDLTVGATSDTVRADSPRLDRFVAPNSNQVSGAFQAIANPLSGLKSISGRLTLRHQPGTPVSQVTVFDTPAIGTISNLTVYLEEGVNWPQLESLSNWNGLGVYRLGSYGSRTTIVPVKVQAASTSAMAASVTPKAASAKKAVVAAKPQPKPKAVPKPAPKPKVVAKPQPKKVASVKR